MVPFVFALLDIRRTIHLAVLASSVSAINACGPTELQVPVHQLIVTPIVRSATLFQHELDRGAAVVLDIGRQLGWR